MRLFLEIGYVVLFIAMIALQVGIPSGIIGGIMAVLACYCWIHAMFLLIKIFSISVNRKAYELEPLLRTKVETKEPNFPKSKIYVSNQGFFAEKDCIALPYEKITWIYKYTSKYCGITVSKKLMVGSENGRIYPLVIKDSEVDTFVKVLYLKNPSVLVGYSSGNAKKYKIMTKKMKNRVQ